ncbi:MAG: hypothetical protein J07HR59_00194 [Halorubrum sp. J07HR59]|nr:MAG: hypothetical protein J07HR59_00194 [Halorubrum sp. J07HR59]
MSLKPTCERVGFRSRRVSFSRSVGPTTGLHAMHRGIPLCTRMPVPTVITTVITTPAPTPTPLPTSISVSLLAVARPRDLSPTAIGDPPPRDQKLVPVSRQSGPPGPAQRMFRSVSWVSSSVTPTASVTIQPRNRRYSPRSPYPSSCVSSKSVAANTTTASVV